MTQRYTTSYIISEQDFAIKCAQSLVEQNQRVQGIITSNPSLITWALSHGIPHFPNTDNLLSSTHASAVDYLFCIQTEEPAPQSITNLIQNQIIRYMPISLEEYSNIHAIPWSILNSKIELGIGWYTQDGFIIEETAVYLSRHETTRSLTLKCHQRGLKLFKQIVKKILENKLTYKNMAPIQFNCLPLYQRPENNGFISWNHSAEEIDRVYRALDYGNSVNDFCSSKFYLNNSIFIIKKLIALKTCSKRKPGTVLSITDKSISISTASQDVAISKLSDLNNQNLSIKKIADQFKLHEGFLLDIYQPTKSQNKSIHSEHIARNEAFWVNTFFQQQENELQFTPNHKLASSQIKLVQSSLPSSLLQKLSKQFKYHAEVKDIVFSALIVYLHFLNNYSNFSFDYSSKYVTKYQSDDSQLLAKSVPFNIAFPLEKLNFSAVIRKIINQKNLLDQSGTFLKDIFIRYPQLQGHTSSHALSFIFDNEDIALPELKDAHIVFILKNNGFDIYVNENHLADDNFISLINNIPSHLKTLLDSAYKTPKMSLHNLEILSRQEKDLILYEWNKTNAPIPTKTIHKLFEEQARKTPDRLAVQLFSSKLSYEKLNQKANQLARYLRKLGVKPETMVGLYFEHCPDAIVAALAVLKAGGAYLPISHDINKKRLNNMIEDAHLNIIITNLDDNLANFQGRVVHTIRHSKNIARESSKNLIDVCSPNNLAYVIFTSGTTGKPKGTLIEHIGVVNLALAQIKHFQISSNSRILGLASYTFDASVAEWYDALLSGAALILVPRKHIMPGKPLLDLLEHFQITVATIPPSLLNATRPRQLPHLTTVISAIEPCNKKIIKQWSKNRIFIDAYGPTENSVCSTMSDYLSANMSATIGKPITNVKTYVLNKLLKPLPVGVVGELYIGGIGLSRGYLNRPELTKEKFVSNPFSKTSNDKLYKSGDLVRWNISGNLEFQGREDEQVKIRGHRIETSEIEHLLSQHTSIDQCVTLASRDSNQSSLIAFITLTSPNTQISKQSLTNFLKQTLPEYMIPSKFIAINKIPLTKNQKIDKSKLSIKLGKEIIDSPLKSIVLSESADKIRKIWSKLLKLKKIEPNENFFELGGHSLLIMKLISQVQKQFKKNISIQKFLNNPTIHTMASMVNPKHTNIALPDPSTANSLPREFFPKIQLLPKANLTTAKAILITGTTGFLGSHLLIDLYKQSHADIYLLVRATDTTHAKSKLLNSFKSYLLDSSILTSKRIHIIIGDFSKKFLGLAYSQFQTLSHKIDSIYHSGANVHHLYNLETLKDANVQSVIELIQFSVTNKLKSINYISTFSTVSNRANPDETFITNGLSDDSQMNGYIESKKISEQLLTVAHSQNIPVNIYRPAWISGHSVTGSWAFENNHLLRLIKGCIQMGVAPNWDSEINLFPVDILSQLIVHSSLQLKMAGKIFNTINSHNIPWKNLIACLNSNGYPIKLIHPSKWRQQLKNIDSTNALFPLLPIYLENNAMNKLETISSAHLANKNTTTVLTDLNLEYPRIDDQLLSKYFAFLKNSDFL